MPINILREQRQAYEVGRIRIGVQVPIANKPGCTRPAKLSMFRFTSRDSVAIHRIAELYGGEARQWKEAPTDDQWEVLTEAREIGVLVPPGPTSVSQWMEMWSGGGCVRRCDGDEEKLRGVPCLCPSDQSDRAELAARGEACKPTTRISLMLPEVPTIGVWRLESHGWNAAHELGGTAELMAALMESRVMVAAVLRLEKRRTVSRGKTKEYVVPVLALQHTPRAMIEGTAGSRIELPPLPPRALAIEAAKPDEAPAGPMTPQQMAAAVLECTDRGALDDLGREARRLDLMDEFVASRFSPDPDELVELIEVFRGRAAELEGDCG